ncbi:uncharacterized protein LOC131952651 isoform X1 [Physella acuta]|uniref:uncharacterized protein LOC131952651 isoform X1 n=1 Tax=Physella acuta TaxID=109671 RepID=UPI0027DAD690|nr:uncharacterized protein LOC131952651 isoform X1 [Physella acuta]
MDCAKNLEPQKSDFKSEMYEDPQATECTASVAAAHNVVPTLQLLMEKIENQEKLIKKLKEKVETASHNCQLEEASPGSQKAGKKNLVGPQPGPSSTSLRKTEENKRKKRKLRKRFAETHFQPKKTHEEQKTNSMNIEEGENSVSAVVTFDKEQLSDLILRLTKK